MSKKIAQYINAALDDDELIDIQYQPQFELCEDFFKITGVEALLKPDTKICHIQKLLSVAIDTSQIFELGYSVMRRTTKQMRAWIDEGMTTDTLTMSINVAGEQLQDEFFCQRVLDIIEDAELYPHHIVLELTETSMINDKDIAKVHNLTNAGINISIDDFGTGYSSLARLKFLPVEEIKIDKMFVDDITKTKQDIAIITAIYQLTHALNKFTIVEGVESVCQYNILRNIGFTCFQGFYFSEALPADEFKDLFILIDSLHCQ